MQIAEIENMFIQEQFRKHGVGKRLMHAVLDELSKRNIKRLKVESIAQNSEAIHFYKKCGFKEFNILLETDL